MINHRDAAELIGDPIKEKHVSLWFPEQRLRDAIPVLPKRIYCSDFIRPALISALRMVVNNGLGDLIHSWDGCFMIRKSRSGLSQSLHSWGLAIDINAGMNPYGKPPRMPLELVQCFARNGFDWGGEWDFPDGMHFQISELDSSALNVPRETSAQNA